MRERIAKVKPVNKDVFQVYEDFKEGGRNIIAIKSDTQEYDRLMNGFIDYFFKSNTDYLNLSEQDKSKFNEIIYESLQDTQELNRLLQRSIDLNRKLAKKYHRITNNYNLIAMLDEEDYMSQATNRIMELEEEIETLENSIEVLNETLDEVDEDIRQLKIKIK